MSESITEIWQSVERNVQLKAGNVGKVVDKPGPTALVLNLTHIAVSATKTALSKASVDEVKNHKGVRVTFMVLQMVSPGMYLCVCSFHLHFVCMADE